MYNAPLAPTDFIRGVLHIKEKNGVRLLVRTAARGTNAHLLINGKTFAAYTHKEEPYDFSTHGFFVPAEVLSDGCTLQLYLEGVLSAGCMMSGLLAGSGLGLLILFRVNKNKKECLFILLLLFMIGSLFGLLTDLTPIGSLLT